MENALITIAPQSLATPGDGAPGKIKNSPVEQLSLLMKAHYTWVCSNQAESGEVHGHDEIELCLI